MNKIKILDIGARGGANTIFPKFLDSRRFKYYLQRNTFEIIGIEPDANENKRLIESGEYKNVFSIAMSDKDGSRELFITKSNDCSSLLRPNHLVIEKIIDKSWWPNFEIVDKIWIDTKRLDTFCEENEFNFDLIKIDVQGVEYEIINGGLNEIENAIGIIAELNSIPWYFKQKSFDDFKRLVKGRGFVNVAKNLKPHIPSESDYLFIKKFNEIKNREDLLKILLLLFIFYKHKLFISYIIKGFFKGFLSISDLKKVFFSERREFFLAK